jgi:hypothetical protein
VARMAPEASAVPVFSSYDLAGQFAVISQVAARSKLPPPRLRAAVREFAVTADRWSGARDRSWGIRPVGEPFLRPRTDSAPSDRPAYPTTG